MNYPPAAPPVPGLGNPEENIQPTEMPAGNITELEINLPVPEMVAPQQEVPLANQEKMAPGNIEAVPTQTPSPVTPEQQVIAPAIPEVAISNSELSEASVVKMGHLIDREPGAASSDMAAYLAEIEALQPKE